MRIGRDNTVTVISKHLEMGQGVYTGLATILADELDAAWSQVRIEGAPNNAKLYNNLAFGTVQGTGNSTAIANSWEQLRNAGAVARAMLIAAAAKKWDVAATTITVREGVVSGGGKKATFGELAEAAAAMPVPAEVKLKDPKDFVLIGKSAARKDSRAKSNGSAIFTSDLKLPDMLTAVVAHPPRFGAKVKSFDPKSVSGLPGIAYIIEVPNGVAVVGLGFWYVKKGRDALKVEWDESSALKISSADILIEYKSLALKPGTVARNDGDSAKAMAGAAKTIEAAYEFPYLAHAAMEPMNCVARLTADRCEVWNGEQFQTGDETTVARAVGLKPEQVTLHMLYAGGSFGRRANPVGANDYVAEAASIAKALFDGGKPGIPVKLVWTREDDMQAGYYRPAYFHTMKAGLDATGNAVAWQHRIVGQSIIKGTLFESVLIKEGIDSTSVEGAVGLPYAIPNVTVDLHSPTVGIPVLWWRSVGSSHNAYAVETFIDQLARAAGKDPVEYRRALLAKHPRHLGVLNLAAKEAGWGTPLAPGAASEKRGRGIAVHESFHSFVANVAEVTVIQGRHVQGGSRRLRGRLRNRGQPGQRPFADGRRHRLRPVGGELRRHHHQGRRGRAVQFPRLPRVALRHDAEGGRAHRAVERKADRRRRAGRHRDRARRRQRPRRGHGPAHSQAAVEARLKGRGVWKTASPVSPFAFAALSFAAFGSAASTRVADALLPRLDADFGIGLGTAAQVVTAFAIAYGLFQAFYGPMGDRFGKYRVIAWTCLASAVTALLCAASPGFGSLVAARFVAGATAAAVIPLSLAWIGDVVPYPNRQPVLARFLTGQIFGFASGAVLGGLAADFWSWRVPFVALAMWFAVSGVLLLRINRTIPPPARLPRAAGQSIVGHLLAEFGLVLRQRWARIVLVVVFLEGTAMFGPFAFLATHIHVAYGLSLTAAGGCLILYAAGGLCFTALSSLLVKQLGEVGLASSGGAVLCLAFLLVSLATWWPLALLAMFLAGLGFYMLHNTLQTNATQMAPERRGAAVALFALSLFIGQAVGVAIGSLWVERIGTAPIIVAGALGLLVIGVVFGRLRAAHAKHAIIDG